MSMSSLTKEVLGATPKALPSSLKLLAVVGLVLGPVGLGLGYGFGGVKALWTALTTAAVIAIGLAILIYWILKRTPYGFDLRALGANPVATEFKGINVNKLTVVTMFISGGLAGLAGAGELFGVHHNVTMGISPGYGYTGIIVAMVAELNPLIVILVAILFGGFINGSVVLATITGTHTSIIFVIQAFVLLSVLICRALMTYRIRRIEHVS